MRDIVLYCVVCALTAVLNSAAGQYGKGPRQPPRLRPRERERLLRTINKRTSKKGPVQLRRLSRTFEGEKIRLRCKANVSFEVQFSWQLNDKTLRNSSRIKIESSSQKSLLTIRKAERKDNGQYKCIARFNGTTETPTMLVDVRPRPTVKLKPKNAIVERGKTIEFHCINLEENATSTNYSWGMKRLPEGPWERVGSNSEKFVWNTSLSRPLTATNYDVYDIMCVVRTNSRSVKGPLGRITVVKPGYKSSLGTCRAEVVDGIEWDETIAGLEDSQPCFNDSGEAKRYCETFPGRPPRWHRPNLRACSSALFKSIKDEISALDEGFKVKIDIPKILQELRGLTRINHRPRGPRERPARIFGQDLLAAVSVLRRTRELSKIGGDSRRVAKESFRAFTETASNLLDLENKVTWEDIDEDNPKTPAELVNALNDFGFDLEEELDDDDDDKQEAFEANIAFESHRFNANSTTLGRDGLTFQQDKSLIRIPGSTFSHSSLKTLASVTVIYNTLGSILSGLNTTQQSDIGSPLGSGSISTPVLLNTSKIISSTVKPLDREAFEQPVKIVLENNGTDLEFVNGSLLANRFIYDQDLPLFKFKSSNRSLQRHCVFWEPEKEGSRWSDEGCRVVPEETTEYITTCECDHLTLFAVMVDFNDGSTSSSDLSSLEVISTVGSAISLAAVILTLIIYLYLWKSLKSPRFVNLINLCLAIALLDVFSVLRGPYKTNEDVCTAMGVLLHYFLLSLFLWMLCEGILLYLLLAEVFKKNYGRKWYIFVHAVGWGIPAVIVTISLGIAGPSEYGTTENCWLSRSNGFIWAAMGPMIAVLLANFVVYGVMLYRVLTSHKVQQEDTVGKLKASVRASIVILPILGFTWTFAVLDFFFDQVAFKYLFAIFNSLQGLFIFLFHCLLNQQVHQALFKTKRPERKSILDRVKTQEMRMTGSQDSLDTLP